jgi:hypothetical protein
MFVCRGRASLFQARPCFGKGQSYHCGALTLVLDSACSVLSAIAARPSHFGRSFTWFACVFINSGVPRESIFIYVGLPL